MERRINEDEHLFETGVGKYPKATFKLRPSNEV